MAKRAINPGEDARKVLIKLGALGDFVLAMGAMKAVREFHPSARITLLTTPPSGLCHAAYFDRIETDGRPKDTRSTTTLRRLRSENTTCLDFRPAAEP